MPVETIPVSNLDVFDNTFDLRRDLHHFVEYMSEREVKRAHRTNNIPKADMKRLAKLMNINWGDIENYSEYGQYTWIDYVDDVALTLGLVRYDTKGVYAGYSSREPSFPDNYIEFQEETAHSFLQKYLGQQERAIFNALMQSSANEFFMPSILGELRGFTFRGSATGVMPTIDFGQVRKFLFDELTNLQSGVWYSTASWIAHIKQKNRYFLIPKNPKYKTFRGESAKRYGNFYEAETESGYSFGGDSIPDDAPNGFERVEGRYIERFLENLPLILRYVDVAYNREPYKGLHPTMGQLAAFRINDHFLQFMKGELAEPRVTVQPNYEVHIESPLYPSKVLAELLPLGDLVSEDTVIVLKLDKRKVAEQAALDENLDVVQRLTKMSDRPLPQNIQVELQDWASQSEKFVLYTGFGLLESNRKRVNEADPLTVEQINDNLRIVRSPNTLYAQLEGAEQFPLLVRHSDARLHALPKKARTVFRTEQPAAKKSKRKGKPELKLQRNTLITLRLPDKETFTMMRHALISARCPIEGDDSRLTLTYTSQNEKTVKDVLKQLEKEYKISIEDV